MMRGFLFAGLGLVACSGGDSADDSGAGFCVNELVESIPADGVSDVYYRTNVRMTLLQDDATARITLADSDGNTIDGQPRVEDDDVIFEPSEPLDQETTYTATLSYECGTETVTFTTSTTGNPLTVDPTDRVYVLDITTGTFTQPPRIGNALNSLITGDVSVLFMPSRITDATIDFIGASPDPSDPTAQNPEGEAFLACDATWTEPYFNGDSESLSISVADTEVTINALRVSGDIAVDGSRIEIERFGGEVDTRQLPTDFGDLCTLVQGFGAACAACSRDPGSITCLDLQVENLVLPYLDSVEPLTSETSCPQ